MRHECVCSCAYVCVRAYVRVHTMKPFPTLLTRHTHSFSYLFPTQTLQLCVCDILLLRICTPSLTHASDIAFLCALTVRALTVCAFTLVDRGREVCQSACD